MKIPLGSTSKRDRLAKWVVSCYESHWPVKFILVPLIVGLPPFAITALYSNSSLKNFLKSTTPEFFEFAAPIGKELVWLFIMIAAVYPTMLLFIGKAISKRAASNGLNVDGLLALVMALDAVVGVKDARFSQVVKNPNGLSKDNVFETITKPRDQITEIVRSISLFFNATKKDKSSALIRVNLAVMNENKVVNIPIYMPADEPVKASLKSLQSSKSCFALAAKQRGIIVISDIAKELQKTNAARKFIESDHADDNIGSMICYPIHSSSCATVPYVISIHSNEPGYFKNEFKTLYEHTLQRFALRISVEHSLFMLKESLGE